jgi:hypothetical protein
MPKAFPLTADESTRKQARQMDARETLSGLPEQMRHGVGPANSPFTIKAERPRKQARQIDARETLSGLSEQMRHGVGPANSPFTIKAKRPRKQARQIDARETLSGLPEQMRHGVGPANSPFTIKAERPRKQASKQLSARSCLCQLTDSLNLYFFCFFSKYNAPGVLCFRDARLLCLLPCRSRRFPRTTNIFKSSHQKNRGEIRPFGQPRVYGDATQSVAKRLIYKTARRKARTGFCEFQRAAYAL